MSAVAPRPAPASGQLRVKPASPRFTDAVLGDVLRISQTPVGRALFRRVRDAGPTVTIVQLDPPTNPPNAWTALPRGLADGRTEIVIACDPADWPNAWLPDAPPSDVVLFGRLEDAVALATGAAPAAAVSAGLAAYLRERDAGAAR